MTFTLLIFKLSVQSSFADNVEFEATELNFDTLQWWLAPNETWRIKTFAIDNDIHTYLIGASVPINDAIENTEKHYSDVILERRTVHFSDPFDKKEIQKALGSIGGSAALEIAPNKRFGFWNPDQRMYSSKSTPSK